MRLILFLCCLFQVWTLSAQINTDKLEAYFSFDHNCDITDDSGNGSTGALINGLTCGCGIRDSCLHFSNADSLKNALYLVGPFANIFTTSDFTVSFYFKPPRPEAKNGTQLVMSKQSGCNTKKAFWVRYATGTSSTKPGKISASISENDSSVVIVQASLDQGPCWQYITITRSNTRLSIYVNGQLRDSKTSATRLDLTSTATFKVGEPVCPLDQYYKGDFDELRFHSKALSLDEIARYNLHAGRILNGDTLIYLGNSFQVKLSDYCAKSYMWQPTTGVSNPGLPDPVITPAALTEYVVKINYSDCSATDTLHVRVIDPDTLDCNKIFIPNAFTPGPSPGRNDVFGISNPFAIQDFISFEIFDRWGGRVFDAANQFDAWDGTFGGQKTNPGVFLYRLRYRCKSVEKVKAGNLTLIR
jgi:gliding motility-associated-like protein